MTKNPAAFAFARACKEAFEHTSLIFKADASPLFPNLICISLQSPGVRAVLVISVKDP